jgi:hypothetical protein
LTSPLPTPHKDRIYALIKDSMGEVNVLAIPRIFITITGSLALASLLSQLLYWSDRAKRKDGFVYKSARDWHLEVGASEYAVDKFNRLPYIETRVKKANGCPTTHYRINFEKLAELIWLAQQKEKVDNDSISVENDRISVENNRITGGNDRSIP